IYLADMSGDGLSDLVRIRNGQVCYWPNRGYGRFGSKVTMDRSPWFDSADLFEQRRGLLDDVDGSGVTDIIYVGRNGASVFLNEAGNGWSAPHGRDQIPVDNSLSQSRPVDLFVSSTPCLS